jgi:hypothetical protein
LYKTLKAIGIENSVDLLQENGMFKLILPELYCVCVSGAKFCATTTCSEYLNANWVIRDRD